MKICAFVIFSLLCLQSMLSAEEAKQQPSPLLTLPTVPEGVNSATYPFPRQDWLQGVKENFAKAEPLRSKIQLVFDGDSITALWPSRGRDTWVARYAKLNAFDFGMGGDRIQNLLWRLSQGQIDGINPKLVAIMIGTNNIGSNTDAQIVEGIKAVVAEYQKRCPGAVILLQGLFPRGEKPTDPARAHIKFINQEISKLGDGGKVIYIDFGDKFLAADGMLPKEIMPDFLHPSAKGYQIWADAIQPIIDKVFPPALIGSSCQNDRLCASPCSATWMAAFHINAVPLLPP